VPIDDFASRVGTVCVYPTEISTEELAERAQDFSRRAVAELKGAGYNAVLLSEEERKGFHERAIAAEGSMIDLEFGWLDRDRVDAVQRRQRLLAREVHGCDAFLELRVTAVRALWRDGVAKWDGREVQFQDYLSAMNAWGWTTVLSLHARVTDLDNQELYFFAGGIQPVIEVNTLSLFEPWRPMSPDKILVSEADKSYALTLALGPLLVARLK
jgi:hypothetical protein